MKTLQHIEKSREYAFDEVGVSQGKHHKNGKECKHNRSRERGRLTSDAQ